MALPLASTRRRLPCSSFLGRATISVMRIYPELTGPRAKQVMADLSVLAFLLGCALLAWLVRTVILTLRVISDAVTTVSDGIHATWSSAADIFAGVPLIGDSIEDLLQGLANGTVGNAADLSRSISRAITLTANVLSGVTLMIPVALILLFWLPPRIRRAQRWDAAAKALGPTHTEVRIRGLEIASLTADPSQDTLIISSAPPSHLLAMRALCMIPFEDLGKYEPRPFEAYAAGRYEGLAAALYAYEGLRRIGS